ncbi:hypothetical protein ABBQ32_006096 [Trebouxia sp. C0010 RCD-2024]
MGNQTPVFSRTLSAITGSMLVGVWKQTAGRAQNAHALLQQTIESVVPLRESLLSMLLIYTSSFMHHTETGETLYTAYDGDVHADTHALSYCFFQLSCWLDQTRLHWPLLKCVGQASMPSLQLGIQVKVYQLVKVL